MKDICKDDGWMEYLENFKEEKVKDEILHTLTNDDLKELIPRMGPRNRIREWLESRK